MISQAAISRLAHALSGPRQIRDYVVERDYCVAWFLTALAGHRLRADMIFKGGTALKRCYFIDYRFSEDMDYTLRDRIELDDLLASLEDVYAAVYQATGIEFSLSRMDRYSHSRCYTFYLSYLGPLRQPREIKVDVSLESQTLFPFVARPILRYAAYKDLAEAAQADGEPALLTYSLEEVGSDKLATLYQRSEPRDLYDLWYLLDGGHFDLGVVEDEVLTKFSLRGLQPDRFHDKLVAKKAVLERLWNGRLGHQMQELPDFDRVFRATLRDIRHAGYLG